MAADCSRDLDALWMRCAVRRADEWVTNLSGGVSWRCANCCCPKPDLLLLDEPTNTFRRCAQGSNSIWPAPGDPVTHDRVIWTTSRNDPGATSRAHPYEGN